MTEKGLFCSDVGECEELKQGWMLKLGGIAMRNETFFWSISYVFRGGTCVPFAGKSECECAVVAHFACFGVSEKDPALSFQLLLLLLKLHALTSSLDCKHIAPTIREAALHSPFIFFNTC